jgi:hypothetical protein
VATANGSKEKGGKMNTKPRLGPDHPQIQAAFSGIYKSSAKMHFRINPVTGEHEKVGVCKALEGVPITYENKMEIIHCFEFPLLPYSSANKRAIEQAKANKKLKPVRVAAIDRDEEGIDDEAEPDDQPMGGKKCQYSLVQQGEYWGCFDAREATVVLFKTKGEAQEHLQDILHGRDGYRISYGGMGNRSRSREAADIHY